MNKKQLSIIIVSYNAAGPLRECLKSIINNIEGIDYEIIVVDNASTDGSAEMLKADFSQITLILNQGNIGYAAANNIGIKMSSGDYVLILNSDTILLNQIAPLLDFMENDKSIGMIGCAIYDANMRLLSPLLRFPGLISELYKLSIFSVKDPAEFISCIAHDVKIYDNVTDVDWVTGCFMLTRRDTIEKTGYMDERYFLYYEDIDLCFSIKNILRQRVMYYPYIKVQHLGGGSTVFSNALYLNQFYKSCSAYFWKNKGKAYSCLFSFSCIICWAMLFLILSMVYAICRNEKVSRKKDMLKYVIKNNILQKNT